MICPKYKRSCWVECPDWQTCEIKASPPVVGVIIIAVLAIGGWALALCTLGACAKGGG